MIRLLAATFALSLAACDAAPPHGGDPAPETATATPAPRTAQSQRPLVPQAIDLADEGIPKLDGELGCSFTPTSGGEALLSAAAFVDPSNRAEAVVDPGNGPVKLEMDREGGFSALAKGGRFAGPEGLIATVAVTGTDPLPEDPRIAMESPRYEAALTLGQDGRTVSVDGFWECGP